MSRKNTNRKPNTTAGMRLYDPTTATSGGIAVDINEVNKQLTPEEQAAWEKQKAAQDVINANAPLPTPGQIMIDPVVAGWQPPPLKSAGINEAFNTEFQKRSGDYQAANVGYNPYDTSQGGMLAGQDFNPYAAAMRNQADQMANQVSSEYAQLAGQGPMSTADRMALAAKFNRAKIQGTLGASQQFDQMQNQGNYGVGQQNLSRADAVNRANVMAQTEAGRSNQAREEARRLSLAQAQFNKQTKDRELSSAERIANIQTSKNKSSNPWNPMEWFK